MYTRRGRHCGHCCHHQDVIETICDDNNCCCENTEDKNGCGCGFDEETNVFPTNPMLAQSYVPIQYMDKTFTPCCGLKNGTIFPELVNPYEPGQSMEEIAYLKSRNEIGEGCNR